MTMEGPTGSYREFLCSLQGDIFVFSARRGLDSAAFIKAYMKSEIAKDFGTPGSKYHCCGELYTIDELESEVGKLPKGNVWGEDELWWIGYTYFEWYLQKWTPSVEIYDIADAVTMRTAYPAYHTLSSEMAVDNLIDDAKTREKPQPSSCSLS